MNKLALQLPGFSSPMPPPLGLKPEFVDLGSVISGILNIAFFAAVFVSFYFLVWGAFAYLMAQGKKEDLAKARARITWALIGLAIILLAFFVAKFVSEIFPAKGGMPF